MPATVVVSLSTVKVTLSATPLTEKVMPGSALVNVLLDDEIVYPPAAGLPTLIFASCAAEMVFALLASPLTLNELAAPDLAEDSCRTGIVLPALAGSSTVTTAARTPMPALLIAAAMSVTEPDARLRWWVTGFPAASWPMAMSIPCV